MSRQNKGNGKSGRMEEWKGGRVEGWKVLDKALMAVPDLEGCAPSQPRNPIETQHWTSYLVPRKQSSHLPVRRRGTGALQIKRDAEDRTALQMLIKAFLASSWPGGLASQILMEL